MTRVGTTTASDAGSRHVFYKLLLVVVTSVVIGATLLVLRQRRIDLTHETSRIQMDMLRQEQALWQLQADLAGRVRPDEIRSIVERDTPVGWAPLPEPAALTATTTPPEPAP